MKEVIVERGTRSCSTELGGCGRVIQQGEVAYIQKRSGRKGRRRRYLCKECYDKKAY